LAFAGICACGRPADSFGGLCDRCVALQTLGLPPAVTDDQIESAYQTLVKVWHPDRFQADLQTQHKAEEKLKEINAAHEFLISQSPTEEPARDDTGNKRPQPPRPPDDRFRAPVADTPSVAPRRKEAQTDEIRRILRRRRKASVPRILLKLGFAVGAIVFIAVLWLVIDSIMSSNPKTANAWDQYKAEVARDVESSVGRLWSGAADNLHSAKNDRSPESAPPPQPSSPTPNETSASPRVPSAPNAPTSATARADSQQPHVKASSTGNAAQPYVTSGLTPMEVLAALGTPTSSSGEKMFYKGSEIDFRDGHVVGWKIDSASPIRVKLWPDAAPTAGISYFTIGSTKSDVIALQGTPTFFSDSRFGYGNSVVLFQNNRVVGWKEDPGSVHLQVAH
jgi:DnaJ domain